MSVYTTVTHDELARWLAPLGTGPLRGFAGIAAGMQNSNYFVTVGGTRRVLTIFEKLAPGELDFYLALQDHLAARGIPCPRPLAAGDGRFWLLRLDAWHHPRPGAVVTVKNPDHFGSLLQRLCLAPEGTPR